MRENAGTRDYMGPEVFDNKTCAASDIWALGVTLYNMVTGDKAFSNPDDNLIPALIKKGEYNQKNEPYKFLNKECKDLLS